jgi:hypothetical protein
MTELDAKGRVEVNVHSNEESEAETREGDESEDGLGCWL